jgi:antitoxin MazE
MRHFAAQNASVAPPAACGYNVITMKTKLIRIGNSQGIRIPQTVIEQLNLQQSIELTVEGNKLIVESATGPRDGWEVEFRRMAELGDDTLLDPPTLDHSFDREEWVW